VVILREKTAIKESKDIKDINKYFKEMFKE